jgi:hypothetical protein
MLRAAREAAGAARQLQELGQQRLEAAGYVRSPGAARARTIADDSSAEHVVFTLVAELNAATSFASTCSQVKKKSMRALGVASACTHTHMYDTFAYVVCLIF